MAASVDEEGRGREGLVKLVRHTNGFALQRQSIVLGARQTYFNLKTNWENNYIAIKHSKEDCKKKRLYCCAELLEAQEFCECSKQQTGPILPVSCSNKQINCCEFGLSIHFQSFFFFLSALSLYCSGVNAYKRLMARKKIKTLFSNGSQEERS